MMVQNRARQRDIAKEWLIEDLVCMAITVSIFNASTVGDFVVFIGSTSVKKTGP